MLPDPEGAPHRVEHRARVALGEPDGSVDLRGDGGQNLDVEGGRRLVELPARRACLLEIAHGQHDLDVRGEEPRALQPIAGGAHQTADGAGGRLPVPLSQAQEGQPRLRLHAVAAGALVGRLGLGHLTAHPMNLRLLIVRAAGGLSIEGAHTAFHRAPGLFERLRPGSAPLHDLRPIGEAVPSEHDELGLSVAPAMQGRGPLARSVERIDPLAARDRVAIDEPCHQR